MEFRVVLASLRRSIWIVVVCALLGAMLAGYFASKPQPYEARAVVSIDTANVGSPDRYMATQLQSLQSGDVRDAVAAATKIPSVVIAREVTLSQQIAADLLVVATRDSDSRRAASITHAYVHAFINHQTTTAASDAAPTLRSITAQIASVQASLGAVTKTIADATKAYLDKAGKNAPIPPAEVVAPDAAAERSALEDQYTRLLDAKNSLQFNGAPAPQLVSYGAPALVVSRSRAVLIGVGMILGLSIGSVIALIRGQLGGNVLDDIQVEELLGAPVLGTLDLRKRHRSPARAELVQRRNDEVLGAVLARAKAATSASPTRVAVASVEGAAGPRVVVHDLYEKAQMAGAVASIVSGQEVHAEHNLLMERRSLSGEIGSGARGDRKQAFAAGGSADDSVLIIDASRIFAHPMLVDTCLEADVIVIVLELPKERAASLVQLARVLHARAPSLLPVAVRTGSGPWRRPAGEQATAADRDVAGPVVSPLLSRAMRWRAHSGPVSDA